MPTEIKAQNTTTLASVKAIYDAADQANTLLDGMQTAAIAAGTTLDGIYQDAADAQTAADDAQASADNASEYAARALGNLSTVQNITETLNWITAHGTMTLTSDVALDPTHVYFVVDAGGDYVVGGTHYSVVTEPDVDDISTYYELSINESLNNYVATHLAVDSEGLWIIPDAGGNKVLIATGSGSTYTTAGTYIVGKVNGVDAVFAKFTADGATMQRGSTDIAHLGYGPGTSSGGGTANAPYYTLGVRTGTVGNYSTAEGYNAEASGYMSHAEGDSTASGYCSHAEGNLTYATGKNSHAQNHGTYAQRRSQTAIGEFNELDTSGADETAKGDYIFIVGNGTGDNTRNNALTVDWSGNTNVDGDLEVARFLNVTRTITSSASISATGDITAGGNVEATGDVTDGAGTSIADLLEVQNTYGSAMNMASALSLSTSSKKIPLKDFNGSGCSLSSNGIKVDKSGVYRVDGSAVFATGFTANDIIHLYIAVNNTTAQMEIVKRAITASPYEVVLIGACILNLNSNDVVYLYAYNQTASRGSMTNNNNTRLTINRIA